MWLAVLLIAPVFRPGRCWILFQVFAILLIGHWRPRQPEALQFHLMRWAFVLESERIAHKEPAPWHQYQFYPSPRCLAALACHLLKPSYPPPPDSHLRRRMS